MRTAAKLPASITSTVAPTHDQLTRPAATLWRDAARRFFRNKLAVGALVVMVLLILTAVFADVIAPAPYDYSILAEANQFPNARHLLGTDPVGRDFLSRLIYGARVSLTVGFSVQAIALLIGVPLGTLAGMRGGWVDYVIMRGVEVMTAVPIWLFALFIIAIWRSSDSAPGSGLLNVIIAIGLIGWVDICRLTRAQLLSLREKDFVLAAYGLGATRLHVALYHLLPNALTPLIVSVTLGVPTAIFTEAGLSFLGFGINDPLPSWGKMVAESSSYIREYWYLGLFPTLLIAITMLSFSFVGDGLRDALDPRLNK
jgi:ABC-type dipeptide/oligopeptide/nickel transport system permease subunit